MLPTKRNSGQNWLPDFFNDFLEGNALNRFSGTTPAMNVIEDENSYTLELAAPGMCKEDFKVHISKDGNLVIDMEKRCERDDSKCEDEDKKCGCDDKEHKKKGRYLRKEFSYTRFHQTLILPDNAGRDNVEACVKDGVLHVRIPKMLNGKEEVEKRIIEVK